MSRVRFTKEDDKLLTNYVKERAGGRHGSSGNKIYQELAEEVSPGPLSGSCAYLLTLAASIHIIAGIRGAIDGYAISRGDHLKTHQSPPSLRQFSSSPESQGLQRDRPIRLRLRLRQQQRQQSPLLSGSRTAARVTKRAAN